MKAIVIGVVLAACSAFGGRVIESFNAGWTFEEKGASVPVDLPHDWAIAGPFDPKGWGATGRLPWKERTATYRKNLILPKGVDDKRHFLRIDGAMAHATVFVNGMSAGNGDYGYLGFVADLTPYLREGTNTIAVTVDTKIMWSRFYCGGGLYRNIWYVMTDEVRLEEDALFATTPVVTADRAEVSVRGRVVSHMNRNESVCLVAELVSPDGKPVACAETTASVGAFADADFALKLEVAKPQL